MSEEYDFMCDPEYKRPSIFGWGISSTDFKPPVADHFDSGKLDILLLPISGIEGICKVFQVNSKEHGGKYNRFNWRKGIAWSKLCASILRHTYRILSGEFIDPESKQPHVYHIAANAVMLGELMQTHPQLNDITGSLK